MRVKDKVALITGASGGMGRVTAQLLAENGAKVILGDLFLEKVQNLTKSINEKGGEAEAVELDVVNSRQVEEVVDFCVNRFGRLDIVVNFAGITQNKKLIEITDEEWDRMMLINLRGSFATIRSAFKPMIRQKSGAIVNISSAAFHVGGGHIGTAHYTASKAGVIGLTKAAAKEGAKYGIRVNVICPGLTETDMTADFLARSREESVKGIPLGRVGDPQDIAEGVLFLVSDASSYITGAMLDINGGLVMR